VQGDPAEDGVHVDGRPAHALVVRRASLAFVVIQASGVAAPTGATSAAPSTTASTLDLIHDVLFLILLRCLECVVTPLGAGRPGVPLCRCALARTSPDTTIHGRSPRDRFPMLPEPEVSEENEHHDHDADDGEEVHVLPRFVLLVC
jgi:hypothetical protein